MINVELHWLNIIVWLVYGIKLRQQWSVRVLSCVNIVDNIIILNLATTLTEVLK